MGRVALDFMGRVALDLSNLKDFDFGKAHAAFQKCLATAVRDLMDRGSDKTARVVTLEASLVPRLEQGGDVVDADVEWKCKVKLPA
jgi:hypothetical protein